MLEYSLKLASLSAVSVAMLAVSVLGAVDVTSAVILSVAGTGGIAGGVWKLLSDHTAMKMMRETLEARAEVAEEREGLAVLARDAAVVRATAAELEAALLRARLAERRD